VFLGRETLRWIRLSLAERNGQARWSQCVDIPTCRMVQGWLRCT